MYTPREAIVSDITRPPGSASPGSSPGATIYRGGHPYQARADTNRFLKERIEGGRAIAAVEFEDTGMATVSLSGRRVHGDDVALVRLIDAVGRTIEARADDGIALLLSNEPVEMPCRIELRDTGGALLAIQAWPPEPSARPR